jgi:hypothetical protein
MVELCEMAGEGPSHVEHPWQGNMETRAKTCGEWNAGRRTAAKTPLSGRPAGSRRAETGLALSAERPEARKTRGASKQMGACTAHAQPS